MATYGRASSGLPDLVRQRTRSQYGITGTDEPPPEVPTPVWPEPSVREGGSIPVVPEGPIRNAPTPPPAQTGYTPAPVPNTSVGSTAGNSPLSTAFTQALMTRLNTPISASLNDPALRAQSDAYAVGQTRARDAGREALAERLAANGISDSGALDTGIQGLYQAQGENQAGFNANLVGNELARQRDELTSYMQMSGARLSATEANQLQARIAEINAALQAQGMTNQNNQFNSNMGWNQQQWAAQQNWMPWLLGMGGSPTG